MNPDGEPVFGPMCRKSPKEEEIVKQAMQKLRVLEVLEFSVSPWATINVFVGKKASGICVIAAFRSLSYLAFTDLYPVKT